MIRRYYFLQESLSHLRDVIIITFETINLNKYILIHPIKRISSQQNSNDIRKKKSNNPYRIFEEFLRERNRNTKKYHRYHEEIPPMRSRIGKCSLEIITLYFSTITLLTVFTFHVGHTETLSTLSALLVE